MNWTWILILSSVSLLTGLLGVYGVFPEGPMQYVISIGLGIAMAFVLSRFTESKFFMNGFTLGVVGGTVQSLVQMLLFSTMIDNNPAIAQRFERMPEGMNPVVMFAVFSPIGIAISGAIQGLLTWVAAMLTGKGSRRRPVPPPPAA